MKGLINALQIDGSDLSISYKRSNLSTVIEYNLNTIYETFKADHDSVFDVDSTDFIYLTLSKTGQDIPLSEYNESMIPQFLTLCINGMPDMTLLVNPKNAYGMTFAYNQLSWLCDYSNMKLLNSPLSPTDTVDGYEKTQEIVQTIMKYHQYEVTDPAYMSSAVYYVTNNFKSFKFNLTGQCIRYGCYLPSIQQLSQLFKYIDMVNYITKKIGNYYEIDSTDAEYWSSTETSRNQVYTLKNGNVYITNKMYKHMVLPFFRKIIG